MTFNMLTVKPTPLLILDVKKAKMNNHEKLFRLINFENEPVFRRARQSEKFNLF